MSTGASLAAADIVDAPGILFTLRGEPDAMSPKLQPGRLRQSQRLSTTQTPTTTPTTEVAAVVVATAAAATAAAAVAQHAGLPDRSRSIDSSTAPRSDALRGTHPGKRKAAEIEEPAATAARSSNQVASDADADHDGFAESDLELSSIEPGGLGMSIDEQGAIAVPASRSKRAGQAGHTPAAEGSVPIPQVPRSYEIEVLQRFPVRDPKNPALIHWDFALRLDELGTRRDQKQCDPNCRFIGIKFDAHFKELAESLQTKKKFKTTIARLSKSSQDEFESMICNDTPASLKQLLRTTIESRHCQGTALWNELKKDPEPQGVILADYKAQHIWSSAIPCAHIPVPTGVAAKQAYKENLGTRSLEDFSIRVKVKQQADAAASPFDIASDTDTDTDDNRDNDEPEFWHAGLYGCGIAQFFNSALADEQAHIAFANAKVTIRDPDGIDHILNMPHIVQIADVPFGKQSLAWYGKGWFKDRIETMPTAHTDDAIDPVHAADDIDMAEAAPADDVAVDAGISDPVATADRFVDVARDSRESWRVRLERLVHESDRAQIRITRDALLKTLPKSAAVMSYKNRRNYMGMIRRYVVRSIDFVERLDEPLNDWVRGRRLPANLLTESEQVDHLLVAAAKVGLPMSSGDTEFDFWRLRPLMQSSLGINVQLHEVRPLNSIALKLRMDMIDPANRLEQIQFVGGVESRLPRLEKRDSGTRARRRRVQNKLIDPAQHLLEWIGARSARMWAGEHAVRPSSDAVETVEHPPHSCSEHCVDSLVNRLMDEGWPSRLTANAARPMIRQLLDLSTVSRTFTLIESPIEKQVERLADPSFDPAPWNERIKGFDGLPDDRARAVAMSLWDDMIAGVERRQGGEAKKRKGTSQGKSVVHHALALYEFWPEPGALEHWLQDIEKSSNKGLPIEDRWIAIRAALKIHLPTLKSYHLTYAKPLLTTLLKVMEIESQEG